MTIRKASARNRTKVIWMGEGVPVDTHTLLKNLQFAVDDAVPVGALRGRTLLAGVAGVVFVQSDLKPQRIVDDLRAHVRRLLDHECIVVVLASDRGLRSAVNLLVQLKIPATWGSEVFDGRKRKNRSLGGDPPYPHVQILSRALPTGDVAHDLAKQLLRYGPQNPPAAKATLTLTGPGSPGIRGVDRLMLYRAFYDCDELHLTEMPDGRSGAGVFIAHARLKQSHLQRRPLPFFVKLGPRHKIWREWQNYEERVREYIPFHLGPRLAKERCALGAHRGVLVGDFVEDSESLGDCSRSARGSTPIGTLFDRTLRNWHLQAAVETHRLYPALAHLVNGLVDGRRLRLATGMGASRSPAQYVAELRQRAPEQLLWGPIHGDLHSANARARGNDAIVIDFLSTGNGPLLSDAAALEVSLIVRSPAGAPFDRVNWHRIVTALCEKPAFDGLPKIDPSESYAWLVASIRQIRLHAFAMERQPGQYAAVLAYRLFQAASTDPDATGPEVVRRATAYWLGDRLLNLTWP